MNKKKELVILIFVFVLIMTSLTLHPHKSPDRISETSEVLNMEMEELRKAPDQIFIETGDVGTEYETGINESLINIEEGDVGDEGAEFSMSIPLEVPVDRSTWAGFQTFMLEYANTQNYTKDGINLGYADQVYKNGVEMGDSAAYISGMGNTGYLVWVLRNTFGICNLDYLTPSEIYKSSEKVEKEALAIGDLGFLSDGGDICGICIGLDDGEPVFSFMDGTWSKKFPLGSNRLCYLQDGKNEYIGQSPPVNFRYFCRPDLPWRMLEADDLKGRISDGKQNEQDH